MYSLYSRKLQGLPNNFLHANKTTQSIYFIWLYNFNYIPKQRMLNAVFRLERATEVLELNYLGKYFACVNAN